MSFAAFLLLLLVVTGAVWALEAAWLRRRRAARVPAHGGRLGEAAPATGD